MKQRLKELVTFLNNNIEEEFTNDKVQELGLMLAYLIALFTLRRQKGLELTASSDLAGFEGEYTDEILLLKNRFSEIYTQSRSSLKKHELLIPNLFKRIVELVQDPSVEAEKMIPWACQYLKRDLEKAAFAKVGKDKIKIGGNELLFTTQFFTDDYMVTYLVNQTICPQNAAELLNIVVIDCASGGGNFLLQAFEKLFGLYQTHLPQWKPKQICNHMLENTLIGYDLDASLSKIAALALFVKACKYSTPSPETGIYIFGGLQNDNFGYLSKRIASNKINNKTFAGTVKNSRSLKKNRIWLTNPPFMGKRDMDIDLKRFLNECYPESKADLCVSFMQKIMNDTSDFDKVGLVTQNNWLYLSSLENFREKFLKEQFLDKCIDLGSNAFEDINGEKTNVILCTFSKTPNDETTFVELRDYLLNEKKSLLNGGNFPTEVVFSLNQEEFQKNSKLEFHYQLSHRFENIAHLLKYSVYANPMQGTSTGNNKEFIKFAWEVNGDPDWKLVSKGGGFSKWSGLSYYKVLWGKNAEKIRNNKGSALRNIDRINETELVFSDTGTLGLNVRVRRNEQVFIASGPGIKVIAGEKYAHLGFLNSRVASFLLKKINPKFTISAGYIGKIPVAEGILFSKTLASNTKKCLDFKDIYLAKKLPNYEFSHANYDGITDIEQYLRNQLVEDLKNDYQRLYLESKIEAEIVSAYNFNEVELSEVKKTVGISAFTRKKIAKDISVKELDGLLSNSLNVNCFVVSRRIPDSTIGTESIFEYLSRILCIHPEILLDNLLKNVDDLYFTKQKYINDLIHKLIIKELGIDNLKTHNKKEINIYEFQSLLMQKYKMVDSIWFNKSTIELIITQHHGLSFFGKPLVKLLNDQITVG